MEFRAGRVLIQEREAGRIEETDRGYRFTYAAAYLASGEGLPVSLTMPLRQEPYESQVLFPFFDGLIPEGWLLAVAQKTWKIDARDRMGLLLACCVDCIGNVSVIPEAGDE